MNTFVDASGNQWRIDINVGTIEHVQSKLGINIAKIPTGEEEESDFDRLATDMVLFGRMLFALAEEQAENRQPAVTEKQFLSAMNGEALKSAREVFWDRLTDFFRQLGHEVVAHALESSLKLASEALANPAIMDQVDRDLSRASETMLETFGKSSGSSPESSELTRVPSPSAS